MKQTRFVTASIYFFLIAGIMLIILPVEWFPNFYDVRYMGWLGLLAAFLIWYVPPGFLVKQTKPNAKSKNNAVYYVQFLITFSFLANAVGDLGLFQLYKIGIPFDKFLHFLVPYIAVIILIVTCEDRYGYCSSYASIAISGMVFGFAVTWEIFELLADHLLKTHISGIYGAEVSHDTKLDLIYDVVGSVSALATSVLAPKYLRNIVEKVSLIKT